MLFQLLLSMKYRFSLEVFVGLFLIFFGFFILIGGILYHQGASEYGIRNVGAVFLALTGIGAFLLSLEKKREG